MINKFRHILELHVVDTSVAIYSDNKKYFKLFQMISPLLINNECARYMDVTAIVESEYRCTV